MVKTVTKNTNSDPLPKQQGADSPGLLLHRSFIDIDELAAFVPEDVKLTQLSLQPFRCDSMVWGWGAMRFSFNRSNCSVRAIGNKTSDFFSFICLLQGQGQPAISHGQAMTEDFLYGFDPHRGVETIFPKNSLHCAVEVRKDVFEACAQAMDRPDLNAHFFAPNYLYSPTTLPPVRAYLRQIHHLMQQRSPLLRSSHFQQLVLQDLLTLLITSLPLPQNQLQPRLRFFQRSHLIRKTEEYIYSNIDKTITLNDISHALGTSNRALSYGFQEIFGMSPIAYLKALRLQEAHRALKTADPLNQTVTSIAYQYGFWSLGHFAKDYRTMFGELPAKTLGRVIN